MCSAEVDFLSSVKLLILYRLDFLSSCFLPWESWSRLVLCLYYELLLHWNECSSFFELSSNPYIVAEIHREIRYFGLRIPCLVYVAHSAINERCWPTKIWRSSTKSSSSSSLLLLLLLTITIIPLTIVPLTVVIIVAATTTTSIRNWYSTFVDENNVVVEIICTVQRLTLSHQSSWFCIEIWVPPFFFKLSTYVPFPSFEFISLLRFAISSVRSDSPQFSGDTVLALFSLVSSTALHQVSIHYSNTFFYFVGINRVECGSLPSKYCGQVPIQSLKQKNFRLDWRPSAGHSSVLISSHSLSVYSMS